MEASYRSQAPLRSKTRRLLRQATMRHHVGTERYKGTQRHDGPSHAIVSLPSRKGSARGEEASTSVRILSLLRRPKASGGKRLFLRVDTQFDRVDQVTQIVCAYSISCHDEPNDRLLQQFVQGRFSNGFTPHGTLPCV